MNNSTRLIVTENSNAMLAYWDENRICRFINNASSNWFGKTPEEVIDKMTIREFLGDAVYAKNEYHIERVLNGETQVFERDFQIIPGRIMHGLVTYHPDIEHGSIKGFFVHVVNLSESNDSQKNDAPQHVEQKAQAFDDSKVVDPKMLEITTYLKEEIFNGFPGLEVIAKRYHISVSKLKRDFKTAYLTTPLIFFRHEQMEYAESHSKEKKISKKELASILNFSNPSNFSSYFKKFIDDVGLKRQKALVKQQSQELNRIFIEQTPFAIAMFDTNMKFLAVSKQFLKDYKLEEQQIIGKCTYEIFPQTTEEFRFLHQECLKGKQDSCDEYYRKNNDGTVSWIKWDIRPWYSLENEIGGLLIYTHDITEKKKSELASIRANYILTKTSELAKIGTWERDLITGKITWNQVVLEMLEIDEFKQASIEENLAFYKEGESRNKIVAAVTESLQSGKPFDLNVEMVTAKQNIKWMRVIGMVEYNNNVATTLSGLFIKL